MKKNGFTVTEMIVATCIGFFFLVVAAVIYQTNIKKLIKTDPTTEPLDTSVLAPTPDTEQEEEKDYTPLEESIVTAMKEYIEKNKPTTNEVLVTKTTEELNIKEELIDPYDTNNFCQGYATYDVAKDAYKGYVRCQGNYATEGYNPEFE